MPVVVSKKGKGKKVAVFHHSDGRLKEGPPPPPRLMPYEEDEVDARRLALGTAAAVPLKKAKKASGK